MYFIVNDRKMIQNLNLKTFDELQLATHTTDKAFVQQALDEHNKWRKDHGVRSLRINQEVTRQRQPLEQGTLIPRCFRKYH